ncbi:MAG TPA: S8 family serine peptidase [Phycicoccus sp.]|nr:S8 family serine peptidase [Phycicoccus sp.]
MSAPSRRRLGLLGLAVAVATTLGFAGTANASTTADQPTSTPVDIATPDGMLMSYVVNAKVANPGQTRLVERAVEAAGGVVVQSWPQIGVVVAHSDRAAFRTDVRAEGGNAVDSVGATRTVSVSEGTPAGIQTPWGPGAADYKKGAKKSVNGDIPGEETPATGSDPLESLQWDMRVINADDAHAVTGGNPNVVVGVLDSGIDATHEDLKANLDIADSVNCSDAGRPETSLAGWQPTTSGHGTHVAGTIAAARNGVGVVGVAPHVRMASVKVVNDDGFIYPEYAVCGFVWAGMTHMDVTNNSYYVDPFMFYCEDQPDQYAAKEAVRRAVAWSTKQGVVHAAAAGNASYDLANKTTDATSPDDGTPVNRVINNGCQDIPTELDGVVTVSSLQEFPTGSGQTRLSSFSNRGLGIIDVAAPGSTIRSTYPFTNRYVNLSGTSMASPHVAGVLALLKSTHPSWTPTQLVAAVKAEAMDKPCANIAVGAPCVGPAEDNSYFGDGVVDAFAAVQ